MNPEQRPSPDFKDVHKSSKRDAASEARDLRRQIHHHDHLYYVENAPEISDAAYDTLLARLQAIEDAFSS